jgi:hypothetical protein
LCNTPLRGERGVKVDLSFSGKKILRRNIDEYVLIRRERTDNIIFTILKKNEGPLINYNKFGSNKT